MEMEGDSTKRKEKKQGKWVGSQHALISTHFSFKKIIFIVLHGFTHCEKLCKCMCSIFTLQQFGYYKMVLHNYTCVDGFLHIHIL